MPSVPDPAVGIVPLVDDDRDAPLGCAAMQELRGRSLVHRAVAALARSGRVAKVLVPVPPALVDALTRQLESGSPGLADVLGVEVLAVHENGPGARLRAALVHNAAATPADGAGIVVVHDPQYPLGAAGLIRDAVDLLRADPELAAVVPVRPVTDTLKWVDEDDVVTATADREGFRTVCSPLVCRAPVLSAALAQAPPTALCEPGPEVLVGLVARTGGRLATLPAPGGLFRVATIDDLLLAEAMLHVDGDVDDEPLLR